MTIFCAARFVPYKHHAVMIDLTHELVLRGYNLTLRLAGDGPLLEEIKSQSEGMGRSILEALTAGTFVIAGKGGALSEVVVPPYGLLINLDDFHTMVEQVAGILKTPLVKRPIGDKFCWSKVFKGYETLFNYME